VAARKFKELSAEQLKKHKPSDIIGFVKSGNLTMAGGLIEGYGLGKTVLLLKGCTDDFQLTKTDKVKMTEWNPLLVAVAFKQLDVVRYVI
jgi:hypothetical protein